ncbi:(2Fe-2S) ferredoxin domain-containing protein [Kitasatospora sp. NBC_00374]|uniref:(2Fe-2S) ferredoxin domain-containing protein n=1 Tax=Kitasatospora sp. NBC_00374 TaxID=2975964 RepID=UPI0032490A9D
MPRSPRKESAAPAAPVTVTVCRGCCCGDAAKYPGVDHRGQLDKLNAGIGAAGKVRVVDCLDVCDHANVVVVSPSAEGRRAGGRPVWLGWVFQDDMLDDITAWVRDGGPGVVEPPGTLDLQAFAVSRRVRAGLPEQTG